MDDQKFWDIIASANGNAEGVQSALTKLSKEDIDAWDDLYWHHHNALHRWDILGAAFVINGGCSDDSFHYFKAFAIGKGRAFYEALLAAPDSIGGQISDDDLEDGCDNESLNYVAAEAYQAQGGEELPSRSAEGSDPAGEAWEEDDVYDLFPNLAAKFG